MRQGSPKKIQSHDCIMKQYQLLFRHMFERGNASPRTLIDLILTCSNHRNDLSAPEWKVAINQTITDYAEK